MSAFVRNLTIVLAVLSAVTGLFIGSLLSLLAVHISNTSELRWSLIVGMPILLILSFMWVNRQPAKNALAAALQSIGLIAIFLSPYWWAIHHAE
jgi:hypothetical protein